MIATKKGLTHIQGSGFELLSDLACIVEALTSESKFSNALIMDFVKAGLGKYITASKILDEFEKMWK